MEKQAVVVQILTYRTNGIEEELDRLFGSLARVTPPEGGWAIVVIDNPSPLGNLREYLETKVLTRAGKELPPVTVHFNEKNTGFAGGHNDGYRFSAEYNPEFVYLLNQDAHVAPDFLKNVVAFAKANPNAAVVQSRIMLGQDERRFNSCGNAMHFLGFGYSLGYKDVWVQGTPIEQQRHGLPMFYASGCGVLLSVAALEKIGGMFDSSYFMYHEDLDVSWRARLAGFEVAYAEDSAVYHHYEFSRSIQKFYWMERNRHITNFTHYRIGTLVCMLPALLAMEIGTSLFAVRSGWWPEKVRAWKHFMQKSTWEFIRARRKHIARIRTKSDREMLDYMVGIITAQEVQSPLVTYVANPIFTMYFGLLKLVVKW